MARKLLDYFFVAMVLLLVLANLVIGARLLELELRLTNALEYLRMRQDFVEWEIKDRLDAIENEAQEEWDALYMLLENRVFPFLYPPQSVD